MVAKKHADQLKRIKTNIEKATSYFKNNADRFHEFRKFVFKCQLDDDDLDLLASLQKPQIEFNILNAYISRLCGEFSKQEPSITVRTHYGTPVDPAMIEVIEGHIRNILAESATDSTQYEAYKDSLSGGFSVFKVWTEYVNERSMDQVIRFGRAFEPTMCGFDPLARQPHKGDGRFCYEYYPYTKEEFKEKFPKVDIEKIEYTREAADFSWAYSNDKEDILVVCDYYEKKKSKRKLLKLANGVSLTEEEYIGHLAKWNESGFIQQPPAIVDERTTEIEIVHRYRLIGNQVLDHIETNYRYLPFVFVDGDSVLIKESEAGRLSQFTKPYIYHAKGAQRLKNFAGQTLANELENMIQHKFKVAQQALPEQEDYLDAYTNIQQANVLVWNAFANNDPDKPIPEPTEIQRIPTPPEVTNAFQLTDQNVQTILGSYDAALGINDNELSGVAIVEGATQSNAAAMPYVVNYMHALNQVAQIIMDLIPKYFVTPRTIPTQGMDGKKGYKLINHPQGQDVMYDANMLNVRVEAGVNFEVQKNRALMQINAMMQSSQMFAMFMNENMDILLDNMSFRNVDIVRQRAEIWIKEQQQARQQQAQQPNPEMIKQQLKMKELEQKGKQMDIEAIMKEEELKLEQANIDAKKLDSMVKAGESINNVKIADRRATAEEHKATADLHLKVREHLHNIKMDNMKEDRERRKDAAKKKTK